ncbi:probable transmembrane reductase CYB561D1 [Wyeomyia smithii]|uniref:probable transmembrane reductase CYB561D1 n=1 Tax=Wyeomyia smithii TaxID=174621 RepID=UPI002467CAC8|nr:probable transmembrane reductase CYB561D1 [Wyeomyia smithii]XP_055539037.1 probable transmembrane reductase CYB561D1 [Wyeomyia smithii]
MENLAIESKPATTPKSINLETLKRLLNILNHVLIGLTFLYTMWICRKNGLEKIFTWHVILCVFGFNVLMAESILLLSSDNTWSQLLTQPQRRTGHWLLQVVGSACVIVGIALEFYWRGVLNKSHFSQTHSILGLIALIAMILSISNGLGALYAIELRQRVKPVYLKTVHTIIGLVCFVTGMVSLWYGFKKRIFQVNATPELVIALQASVILIIILSIAGAVETVIIRMISVIRNIR